MIFFVIKKKIQLNVIQLSIIDPIDPEIVLLGLILVIFGPLNVLPNIYPPISEAIQVNKRENKIILNSIIFEKIKTKRLDEILDIKGKNFLVGQHFYRDLSTFDENYFGAAYFYSTELDVLDVKSEYLMSPVSSLNNSIELFLYSSNTAKFLTLKA